MARNANGEPWPNAIYRPASLGFVGRSDRFDSPSYRPWAVEWHRRSRASTQGTEARQGCLPVGSGVGDRIDGRRRRPLPTRDRHNSDAFHGRRPEGQLRPSRRPDGDGADGLHAVDAIPAPRPQRPELAESRPLPALRRPRQHAALLAALSDRLRPDARGPAVFPPVGLAHSRPPRAWTYQGCRGDDRTARPGIREWRRDGDCPAPPRV